MVKLINCPVHGDDVVAYCLDTLLLRYECIQCLEYKEYMLSQSREDKDNES